jgi:uncharacterized protein (TIGR02598 family)
MSGLRSGFSLVEVTLTLGIIAFALISILALVPIGMKSSGEAIDATHTALIGQDVQKRVKSTVVSTTFAANSDVAGIWFYDRDGFFLGTATSATAFYRANTIIHKDWGANAPPANVDATLLRPVTVQLRWPIDPATGNPLGTSAAPFTFYVRRP